MYEAFVGTLGYAVLAEDYEDLPPRVRLGYADSLTCTDCGQPAYFIRQARNGRAACFGARPHLDGCGLASTISEAGGSAFLPEDNERLTSRDEFVIRPIEHGGHVTHVTHDPNATGEPGRGRRFSLDGDGRTSTPSMGMSVLLRRLLRNPEFRTSRAMLVLPDGSRGSVRTQCVDVIDAGLEYRDKLRLYWGTIRYASQDGDVVWLNLGRHGAPALKLDINFTETLLDRHGLDDVEDLQGASFLAHLFLRKSRTSDRLFLFPEDLDWFALRLPDEDPI